MTERALPLQTKADDWVRFNQAGIIDRLRCVVPLAVHKDPSFASTLGYNSRDSFKGRAVALIDRPGLGLVRWAIAYRRGRIWRRYTRVEFAEDPSASLPSSRR